jgi:UDP-2-acetamido-2-deoxy-ribo-hexuluronate aminotransferase
MVENIQMVDLKSQYKKIKDEVDYAIQEVIDTTSFINGPLVAKFAQELGNYPMVPMHCRLPLWL